MEGMLFERETHRVMDIKKNPVQAIEWIELSINKMDASDQAGLGVIYFEGIGCQKDAEKSLKWFRKAAIEEDATALDYLGIMFLLGKGVQKDVARSFVLTKKAAEKGVGSAQYRLGNMYRDGVGTERNPKQAADWYIQSAAQGNVDARDCLAVGRYPTTSRVVADKDELDIELD